MSQMWKIDIFIVDFFLLNRHKTTVNYILTSLTIFLGKFKAIIEVCSFKISDLVDIIWLNRTLSGNDYEKFIMVEFYSSRSHSTMAQFFKIRLSRSFFNKITKFSRRYRFLKVNKPKKVHSKNHVFRKKWNYHTLSGQFLT